MKKSAVRTMQDVRGRIEQLASGTTGATGKLLFESLRKRLSSPVAQKLLVILVLSLIWELGVRLGQVKPVLFPPLSAVLVDFIGSVIDGSIIKFAWASLYVLLIGMLIGVALACVLAAFAILSRSGRYFLEVLVAAMNSLPGIGLFPLALLWFGLGINAMVFVVIHSVMWQMALNTYMGFATVNATILMVGRNLGLRGWRLVLEILVPSAFPGILTGLKVGWAFGWRTVIAAELVFGAIGIQGGLGWYIYLNKQYLETASVFSGLLTIILIGLFVENAIFQQIEKRTIQRWGMTVHGR